MSNPNTAPSEPPQSNEANDSSLPPPRAPLRWLPRIPGCGTASLTTVVLGALLSCGVFWIASMGYVFVRIQLAKHRIPAWCQSLPPPGTEVDIQRLAKDAEARGFRVLGPTPPFRDSKDPPGTLRLSAMDGIGMRFFCDVKVLDGKLVSAATSSLD